MYKRGKWIASLAVLALTGVVAGCGTSNNTNSGSTAGNAKGAVNPTSNHLGTITLYTSDGLEDYYKAVLPQFEKEYGAKVVMVTDGSGAVVNRLDVEKNSPKADVVVTMPPFVQKAQQEGLLQDYRSTAWDEIPSSRKDANGYWETFIDNYINFAYNPQLTPNPPKTFNDLLSAQYKNQVAYSNPQSAGDGMAVLIMAQQLWGTQKAMTFLKSLEPSVKFHTKGTGYLDVLLNRGEVIVANGDLQMDMADNVQGGMSVKPLFLAPSAGQKPVTFEDPYVVGLVKNSPNTAGGEALINYLLSKSAQAETYSIFGLPARTDVPATSANAKEVESLLNGVQVLPINWSNVLDSQTQWQSMWQSEVLNAYGKQGSVTGN
ncbi:2-aminoethylphosphonate ABC transporter substrate-binding protein [Alicyclobacillus dauci]|uniref:2-aminoethylphosphonate ABC transporter substrate-binding protein n=1 Tax=Alicyclobacillus dauci TaxID=1475485 RepID=A0ABY6YZS5_9BACL|nr:2-aminoethylphosphonate ABC transporter substrate-binding protein [Alicyclobacillus dauci]WAH36124.1 2-aminoethylphosphonate ABC transporter substrate-binding protein [Alicyclobacillus dauci]